MEEAKAHLDNIKKNTTLFMENSGEYVVLKELETEGSAVIYPFLEGSTFSEVLIKLLKENKTPEFIQQIKQFKSSLYSIQGEYIDLYRVEDHMPYGNGCSVELNNVYCIKPANLDLVFDNIIVSSDGVKTVIDSEWVFDAHVPVDFIFFRSLYSLWIKYKSVLKNTFENLKNFMASFDIFSTQVDAFLTTEEEFFQSYVYGDNNDRINLQNYKKPRLSFPHIQNMLNNNKYSVAVRDGDDNIISLCTQAQSEEFSEISFDFNLNNDHIGIQKNIVALQPVDKQAYVMIKSIVLYNEFGEIKYSSHGGFNDLAYSNNLILFEKEESFCFIAFNNEPRIILPLKSELRGSKYKLIVKMKVDFNLSFYYREVFINNLKKIDDLMRKIDINKDHISSKNKVIEKKDLIIDSQSKRIENYQDCIDSYKKEIESYERNINVNKQHIEACEQKIEGLEIEIEELENKLVMLLESKSWRITAPLRKVKRMLGSDENN
ncbi:hypothetical protein [Paenibacillus sp. JGP012]|uniref:hypothetical protein n=1 Tax=Paenibacillus sp. JGP012 TaxID=2735914 RepID=UPI00161871A6|nr:hypothetical protein [Paenibacillus sp. JGP012]